MHLHKHNNINNFVLHSTVTESCSEATCCWREGRNRFRVLCWILSVACSHLTSYGQTWSFNFLMLPFSLMCTDAHIEMHVHVETFPLCYISHSRYVSTLTHTHALYNGLCFLFSSFPAPIWWQCCSQVPQMTIEIELTDESSSKTLAVMVLQLRLTAHISHWWLCCPASLWHLQEWATRESSKY